MSLLGRCRASVTRHGCIYRKVEWIRLLIYERRLEAIYCMYNPGGWVPPPMVRVPEAL